MNGFVEHACIRTIGPSLLGRLGVLITLAASACSTRGDSPIQPESGRSRIAPVFGGASELVEAESRTCDLSEYVTEADAFVAAVGKTPEQLASDVDVRYSTVLRWATIVPPFDGISTEEKLDVALSYEGNARLYPDCSNLVELDMHLGLNSQSGALGFDGQATVSYSQLGGYRARASLLATDVPEWQAVLEPVTLHDAAEFLFELALSESGAGRFLVRGPEGATCPLASWPAQRICELGERAILADETFLGLQTNDIIAGVQAIETTHGIQWEDTSATAQMTVDFIQDDSRIACVLPLGMGEDGQGQFRFSVLGRVRLTTDDGRLDVTLPTRARTRGSEGVWSNIELFTSPVVAPAAEFGVLPIEGSRAGERAVVSFSSPQPPITPQSTRLRGGFDVQVVALQSATAEPTTASCIAGNFMGVVSSMLTSAAYLPAMP